MRSSTAGKPNVLDARLTIPWRILSCSECGPGRRRRSSRTSAIALELDIAWAARSAAALISGRFPGVNRWCRR
jgi:hypothetical protein